MTRDTIVQKMKYHVTELPMRASQGESIQNRKYNGKEFIDAYRLNEYDSQARRYYPAIARATNLLSHEKIYSDNNIVLCGGSNYQRSDCL